MNQHDNDIFMKMHSFYVNIYNTIFVTNIENIFNLYLNG